MGLGDKIKEKVEEKSCSCVKNEGRNPYCTTHGDQKNIHRFKGKIKDLIFCIKTIAKSSKSSISTSTI